METVLPVGAWIRYRYEGGVEYAEIVEVDGEKCIRPMCEDYVPLGTVVQPGVWKKGGSVFEPRGKPVVVNTGGKTPPSADDLFKETW